DEAKTEDVENGDGQAKASKQKKQKGKQKEHVVEDAAAVGDSGEGTEAAENLASPGGKQKKVRLQPPLFSYLVAQAKTPNTPFQRVKVGEAEFLDDRMKSNAFAPEEGLGKGTEWGARANEHLSVVKGKVTR